ncbi:MutS protein 2 [Schizosaccharomyces cryophilus OY26]|uniref:MutS protein 2 n=1 Tax=Schizosaccharomyces cryophilus (strain OY26 / ATCC MYA-4695 / CBS 11777 / NBRC 106824 / NRRL Y48691) TaxID=653667 RepID=S9W4P3_SCHCR|nr:MutS protein 2 [Schizosaccharomyces cryophilus OY26]EPY52880.1 MutS protein 2 [Schizosaccharomyces cryophilus OY26]
MSSKSSNSASLNERTDESRMFSFYEKMPKDSNTLRVFDRGETYVAIGEDASFVAQNAYHTTSVLKYHNQSNLSFCTMFPSLFIKFAEEVLSNYAKRVEIWGSNKSKTGFDLLNQASPGNMQMIEDLLMNSDTTKDPTVNVDNSAGSILLAVTTRVKQDQRIVGVTFIDPFTRKIGVSEFVDSDSYTNFEALLVQTGAKECLISQQDGENTATGTSITSAELNRLRNIIEGCGALVTGIRSSYFSPKDVELELAKVLDTPVTHALIPELSLQLAMGSCNAVLRYLGPNLVDPIPSDDVELQKDLSRKFHLYQHNLEQYMRLDVAAVRALNLLPPANGNAHRTMSLYGLLNHCRTPMGARQLRRWIVQPLLDPKAITRRHKLVSAFIEDPEVRQLLLDDDHLLRSIPDVPRLCRRLIRGSSSLEDVVRIYQMAKALPNIVTALDSLKSVHKQLIDQVYTTPLSTHCKNLTKLIELVETTIDLEALDAHKYIIRAEFDEELLDLRQRLEELENSIFDEHKQAGVDLQQDTEKKLHLEQHHLYGWCLRLTRAEAGCLRGRSSRYSELSTQKNGVYFTTKRLHNLNSTYMDYQKSYRYHQNGLAREVIKIAATYSPPLEAVGQIVSHLDVITSFALASTLAVTAYVCPTILDPRLEVDTATDNQEKMIDVVGLEENPDINELRSHLRSSHCACIELKQARHPCLEAQDDVNFIPNDILLKQKESEMLIITGPNMGGKSTYIRQAGVITVMAQIGCFVPCDSATIDVVDAILARVGAGDSQLKGVSTFMAEMLETATILRSATPRSLIIIDELGRGTSTTDGFGLAWAITEHIVRKINCFCLFATHYHEMTRMSEEIPTVKNLHVTAHVGDTNARDVALLYNVRGGASDRSFGIHVAELAHFPAKIIEMAQAKAMELEAEDEAQPMENGEGQAKKEGIAIIRKIMLEWQNEVGKNMPKNEMLQKFQQILTSHASDIEANSWLQAKKGM